MPAGERHYKVSWQFKGGIALRASLPERLGGPPPDEWPQDTLNPRSVGVDLSFLNRDDKPAGRRGPVKAQGDSLVFADGTPARFWGTNITAYALFTTPKESVREQAKRIAALGYNLVRLHHHDSAWVGTNIFGNYKALSNTQVLDAAALERLDWWVKCLKDEGIYLWLDLHVGRAVKAGDNITDFDEMRRSKDTAELKGFNYVNASVQSAMKRFNEAYLSHKNVFTGVANKDEPAVVALLITNENDLTHHFGNALLPDKGVPLHNKLYTAAADEFARATGLPRDRVWRSWEHGPSKLFLNELERRFDVDMLSHLRQQGAKALAVTTSTWGNNPLSSLPALTAGDMVDVHAYSPYGTLEKNPLFGPNFVHWLGAAQVVGYPMTVTEWNAEPFPLPDRHALPLYVAATAAHQGWDALMHYAYTQQPPDTNGPSNWHAFNDPSLLAMMPAAALLYRERHVSEATRTYVFDPGAAVFFGQAISPANSAALRTAMEKGRLQIAMPSTKELPWLQRKALPAGAVVLTDPSASLLPRDATEAQSDTGQLSRNWAQGVFTINTPRTRAAMGWIGDKSIVLPDVELKLMTRNASVAVQSLDAKPVGDSASLLISLGTRSQPRGGNKTPFQVEPANGQILVRAPRGLKCLRVDRGDRLVDHPCVYDGSKYRINLDGKAPLTWIYLRTAD
ncbi:MAG: cellulase family glycosylhydrolase [Burkholderiales bacterium]|nr:cellulase family glycosylhydrolase [Burkholderiales bacterium]